MVTKTSNLLRTMKQQIEKKTPIASEMFIPNHSGDLSAGSVLTTPTQDLDVVNKKYVDDSIAGINQYSDEKAQDAVGAMAGTSLTYVDATPSLNTVQDIRTSATPQFTRVGAGISPTYIFEAYTTNSGIQGYKMKSTSTTALNSFIAYNNNDAYVLYGCAGSAYTTVAILQNRAFVDASSGTDGLVLNTENSADPIIFAIGSVSQGQISNNAWKIGSGVANIDYTLTFDGETNDGLITWMEDEDYFLFGDDIYLSKVVYDDLQFIVGSGKLPAANYPTYETFTTSTRAYAFSVDDYLYCDANEIPHWWKQGTAGDAHLHFTIKTIQNSGANRFAKFEIIFAYADTNEVWVEQTMTGEYTIPTGTAALTNLYVDMGNVTLTNYLIGAQITARVKRIAATGGTEYADDVYITQTGIHLQKDTLGSRQETIK